jgi:hypothetical protein
MATQTELSCPSCGGRLQIANRFIHLVVCPFCNAAIIVDEKVARIAGEMSTLPADDSPLYIGATGKFADHSIRVLGRVRYGYARGNWDEWYVVFDDQVYRWISIDGDEWSLEEHVEVDDDDLTFDGIQPGQLVRIGKEKFHAREKDIATCEGGEGQLPFRVMSNEKIPFIDLQRKGAAGTLEFEESKVRVFFGRPIDKNRFEFDMKREDAGVGGAAPSAAVGAGHEAEERVVRGQEDRSLKVNCRGCGAPLDVQGVDGDRIDCTYCGCAIRIGETMITCPDCGGGLPLQGDRQIQMIHCAYCGSQLNIANPDEPDLLEKVLLSEKPDVPFKLGQMCKFDEIEFEVVGFLRCEENEGYQRYYWDDFLLFNRESGYRWLSLENGHVTLASRIEGGVEGLPPGAFYPKWTFVHEGKTYKVFEVSRNLAKLSYVDGELPWVAKVGDAVNYGDAICPPYGITIEWSGAEVEYYRSRYVDRRELEVAFDPPPENLPKPQGVAPTQPYSRSPSRLQFMKISACFGLLLLVLGVGSLFTKGSKVQDFSISSTHYMAGEDTESFEIKNAPTVCRAKFESNLNNGWVYLVVSLVGGAGEQKKELLSFSKEMSFYSGSGWSEGSRKGNSLFRIDAPGEYKFHVQGEAGSDGGKSTSGPSVMMSVYQGALPCRYFLIFAIASLAYPAASLIRQAYFEKRRWAPVDSDDDDGGTWTSDWDD